MPGATATAKLSGKTAASGGIKATLDNEPDKVRAALRVLMETPGYASHHLSASPRVPTKVQQAVAAALLKLGSPQKTEKIVR
jgi:ABC-type phosphate/phosphonate transport system substrate-binding protein